MADSSCPTAASGRRRHYGNRMNWSIDRSSPLPLYVQVQELIRSKILDEAMGNGAMLPSEQQLALDLEVSRITVKRALDDLAQAGWVKRIQGKGTIVDLERASPLHGSLQGFRAKTIASGRTPGSRVLSVNKRESTEQLRQLFNLPDSSTEGFYAFRRMMTVDEQPAIALTVTVREYIGEELLKMDLDNASFYELYGQVAGSPVERNEVRMVPIVATPKIAEVLAARVGSPHVRYQGMSYLRNDEPVEYSVGIFAGDLFEWRATLHKVRELDPLGDDTFEISEESGFG